MGFSVKLKSISGGLQIGEQTPVRVNCNVGANTIKQMAYERERLRAIKESPILPDTFMDLSIGLYEEPLYKVIIRELGCPVGVVPAYFFPLAGKINKTIAIDILKRLADDGLSFFTFHLTANKELFEIARHSRKIPMTSRGGGIVLRQAFDGNCENIWTTVFPEIIDIAKEYKIVISLGTTFRPAGIDEACDEVHLRETDEQLSYCRMLQKEGVQVMVENVGHIALDKLEKHCKRLRQFEAPVMPLGPLPTDCAEGEDHIAAAIGATAMGYWNCAHIINCITRSEHSKPFFSIEETLEAIKTAKLAAHVIDVARGINIEEDAKMLEKRASLQNCLGDAYGDCYRCAQYCPLKHGKDYGTKN